MNLKKMQYVANSKIPSRHANSVQVVNMICAFSQYVDKLTAYLPGTVKQTLFYFCGYLFAQYGKKIPKNCACFFLRVNKNTSFENVFFQKNISDELCYTRSIAVAKTRLQHSYPVLFESHVFTSDISRENIQEFISLVNKTNNSGVIAISEQIKNEYMQYGLAASNIFVAPDAVSDDFFIPRERGFLGKIFGEKIYKQSILVYTGSLREEKGAQFLAKMSTNLDAHVVIIGGKKEEHAVFDHTQSNLFFHPSIAHKKIPEVLYDADVLVMPYLPQGELVKYMSPLKLFEYLATGKPLLAADLPVFNEIIANKGNCYTFKPGSAQSFLENLQEIWGLPFEKKSQIACNAIEIAKKYTWKQRAEAILSWYVKNKKV